MSLDWYDIVGTLGVVIILAAYFLLQVGRIHISGLGYSVANLIGAALITVSLLFEFNFSAFLIEVCWMLISIVGIIGFLRRRRDQKTATLS